jgi:hypothetical protein
MKINPNGADWYGEYRRGRGDQLSMSFRVVRSHDHWEQRGGRLFTLDQLTVKVLPTPGEYLVRVDTFCLSNSGHAHPRLKRQLHDPTLLRNLFLRLGLALSSRSMNPCFNPGPSLVQRGRPHAYQERKLAAIPRER